MFTNGALFFFNDEKLSKKYDMWRDMEWLFIPYIYNNSANFCLTFFSLGQIGNNGS